MSGLTSCFGGLTSGEEPRYPLNVRLCGYYSRFGPFKEENVSPAEIRTPDLPASNTVTTPTTLSQHGIFLQLPRFISTVQPAECGTRHEGSAATNTRNKVGRFTLLFNLVKRALSRVFRRNQSQGDTVIMDNVMLSVAHAHMNSKLKGVSLVGIMLLAFMTSALNMQVYGQLPIVAPAPG